jgi:dipeptidyl-peptidase-4
MAESYPHQSARTRGFNLGLPHGFQIADDGSRVAFVRSPGGDVTASSLWVFDVAEDHERLVFDPADAGGEDRITDEERDRRERIGERQTGVVAFAGDPSLRAAALVVGGRLLLADLINGGARALETAGPAFDPRLDPTGRRVAYVTGGSLHVIDLGTGEDSELAADDDPDVRWGVAEFIAAEEMERRRGYWWAPDGEHLIVARVDERAVETWYISAPIRPELAARPVRYPRAGAANADVTLHVLGVDGSRVDVGWDRAGFEYVVVVEWSERGAMTLVQSRDQRTVQVLAIDPATGATSIRWEDRDPRWTHITPGVPRQLEDGGLLVAAHRDDTRRLLIDDRPVTPVGLQVDSVVHADEDVVFLATEEPTELHVWRLASDGVLERLTDLPGVHAAAAGDGLVVLVTETVEGPLPTATLFRGGSAVHTFERFAETPVIAGRPRFVLLGARELRTAVLTPGGEEPAAPLPVLLDPYGGPHWGRAARTQRGLLESQWFADQGFVVLVIDGRGTPYRGVDWDQAVHQSYVDVALEDQVDGLHAAAERLGYLDLSRVAIRGWSYGGYLTLGALLRRPDVFHAGVSGAPVTDMRYYDTHYTERYLGTPQGDPEAYANADLIPDAANLVGELLLLHGLADDNVHIVHGLRMSRALLEAGRRHTMIPLSGITHRAADPLAADRMLTIEVEFLRRALRIASPA